MTLILAGATISGQTASSGSGSVTIRATDITGEYTDQVVPYLIAATATVPDVSALSLTAATAAISAVSLVAIVSAYQFSDIVALNVVSSQSPAAGSVLSLGSPVFLTISLGRQVTAGQQGLGPALTEIAQGSVRVVWGAAIDLYGAPVTGYRLYVNQAWDGQLLVTRSALINGLMADTPYRIELSAVDAYGFEFGLAPACYYSYSSQNSQKIVIDPKIPPWKVWGLGKT